MHMTNLISALVASTALLAGAGAWNGQDADASSSMVGMMGPSSESPTPHLVIDPALFEENPAAYHLFATPMVEQLLGNIDETGVVFPADQLADLLELAARIEAKKPALYAEYVQALSKATGPVDVTAEACKNEDAQAGATCTGSYTYRDDYHQYSWTFGDVDQSVCTGYVITNIIYGSNNVVCNAYSNQYICFNGECSTAGGQSESFGERKLDAVPAGSPLKPGFTGYGLIVCGPTHTCPIVR